MSRYKATRQLFWYKARGAILTNRYFKCDLQMIDKPSIVWVMALPLPHKMSMSKIHRGMSSPTNSSINSKTGVSIGDASTEFEVTRNE
jgi:hypothetical protein